MAVWNMYEATFSVITTNTIKIIITIVIISLPSHQNVGSIHTTHMVNNHYYYIIIIIINNNYNNNTTTRYTLI
jgi:hypothetical protein